jgi:hypothetical protein
MKAVQARLERLESDGAMAVQPADQSGAVPTDDSNLITRINQLQLRTLSILQRADTAGRADVALKAIREARGNMELLARLNQISGEAGEAGYCVVMSFGDVTINAGGNALPGGQVIGGDCEIVDELDLSRGVRR